MPAPIILTEQHQVLVFAWLDFVAQNIKLDHIIQTVMSDRKSAVCGKHSMLAELQTPEPYLFLYGASHRNSF